MKPVRRVEGADIGTEARVDVGTEVRADVESLLCEPRALT